MKKFYEKSELRFTLVLIIIYSVGQSFATSLNKAIGIDYSANDVLSAFANDDMSSEKRVILSLIHIVIVVAYTLILLKTVPKKQALVPNKEIPNGQGAVKTEQG